MARTGRNLALSYYEDLLALATVVAAAGYPEDAARCREAAAKIRPAAKAERERVAVGQ